MNQDNFLLLEQERQLTMRLSVENDELRRENMRLQEIINNQDYVLRSQNHDIKKYIGGR